MVFTGGKNIRSLRDETLQDKTRVTLGYTLELRKDAITGCEHLASLFSSSFLEPGEYYLPEGENSPEGKTNVISMSNWLEGTITFIFATELLISAKCNYTPWQKLNFNFF